MNISLNWLKQYINIELDPKAVGDLMTSIGLEVEGMEVLESVPGGLAGVVVGEVLTCELHPNADRLRVTTVDVGEEEPLSIVCGAPNVAKGQKVVVATVGTVLHPVQGEPFKIKKSKIRGEESRGMICAEDELGLGESHDGIIVLPADKEVGTPAREIFNLETDYVYDVGLTPNRSDATAHLGVAFDLAAALRVNHGYQEGLNRPDVSAFKAGKSGDSPVDVEVRDTEACPRFSGLVIEDLEIGPSPAWLQNRLRSVGVRPINNVVDITNFVLHEIGQPLHAYDLSKIDGERIIVTTLPEGTKFTTLDEVERKLTNQDLMICDGHEKAMCIGGVFGGMGTGVSDSTKSIFLEAAHFNAKRIRRSSMHHDLRTDAAKVFEKTSDPNATLFALKRAALLLEELAGGKIVGELIDIYPEPIEPVQVTVKYNYLSRLIGVEMKKTEVHDILAALEMDIVEKSEEAFTVAVPTNKADVTRPADVMEEVLRIYGFDRVSMPERMRITPAISTPPDEDALYNLIADQLVGQGFLEGMSLSLHESAYYGEEEADSLVAIHNTSNEQLDVMRADMVYSALEAVKTNANYQEQDLRLFEFGRTYHLQSDGSYSEPNHLTLTITGRQQSESWRNGANEDVDFFSLKPYVDHILKRLGISGFQHTRIQESPFAYALQYHRGPKVLVKFGQIDQAIVGEFGIDSHIFYADFNWDEVIRALPKQTLQVKELDRYPSARRDLALVVDKSVKFEDIAAIARKTGKKLLRAVNLFDVYESEEQLGAGRKSYAISLIFQDEEKTLQSKQVDKLVNQLIGKFEDRLGAMIRR